MRTTVSFENESLRQVAGDVELADRALRQSFSGFELDAVEREVRRSIAELDLELSDAEITDYARAIRERRDHELVLG